MVDAAHDKEARARDTVNQLKLEIANLTKLVEQGAGLNFGEDTNIQELMKAKEELTKQRDAQLEEIVQVAKKNLIHSQQSQCAGQTALLETRLVVIHNLLCTLPCTVTAKEESRRGHRDTAACRT